jgi:hypothetical protein
VTTVPIELDTIAEAGVKPVRDRGLLVSQVVIPRPSPELFEEYL